MNLLFIILIALYFIGVGVTIVLSILIAPFDKWTWRDFLSIIFWFIAWPLSFWKN